MQDETDNSPPPRRLRTLIALGLWIGLGVLVWNGLGMRREAKQAEALCARVEAGDWQPVLAEGPDVVRDLGGTFGDDGAQLSAAAFRATECLALAHFGAGQPEEGLALLEKALVGGSEDLPRPLLTVALVDSRRRSGDLAGALDLARRGVAAYPEDPSLATTELDLRLEAEDPETVLASTARGLAERGRASTLLATRLALRYGERREFDRAEAVFGPAPPSSAEPAAVREWFRARAAVHGMAGDAVAVRETCRRWMAAGGNPAEVLAWHGLTLSLYQLQDAENPVLPMLLAAVERRHEIDDPILIRTLYVRLVGTLIVAGEYDEARARLDEAMSQGIELAYTPEDISRSEMARSAEISDGGAGGGTRSGAGGKVGRAPRPRGKLAFQVVGRPAAQPPSSAAQVAAAAASYTLWVSPDPLSPVDTEYQLSSPVSTGPDGVRFEVDRTLDDAPQRWVLEEDGSIQASGSVWPAAGEEVEVRIELSGPTPDPVAVPPIRLKRRPADGKSRVLAVILDCADWRLVQYLRARSELPFLEAMLEQGLRGILWSEPAFTAAAMAAIAAPSDAPDPGVLAHLHRLGSEIGSNPFLGGNPLAGLEWLVQEPPSLFQTVGSGSHVALNLLFSKGEVRAGRHGERVGPWGEVSTYTDWQSSRPSRPEERRFFPDAAGPSSPQGSSEPGSWQTWIDSAAAVLDAASNIAGQPDIDLALVRIAAFDAATHAGFARISRGRRDDGRHRLFDLYRYVDHRLAEIDRQLDADDVLVVLSDHGIRTSLEHDERSFFVAMGGDIEAGRLDGRPHLRGLPGYLANLLKIDTQWPETGFPLEAAEPTAGARPMGSRSTRSEPPLGEAPGSEP